MPDPTMPKLMPTRVERELRERLGWWNRPNPIDLYLAIREALIEELAEATPKRGKGSS